VASRAVVVVSLFDDHGLPQIAREVVALRLPADSETYIGSYGISRLHDASIAGIPGAKYAPMFSVQPDTSRLARQKRRVSAEEAALLDAAHAGEIPQDAHVPALPATDLRDWGIELGRRFRDQLRAARRQGLNIAPGSWQLDEIVSQCGDRAEPNRWRQFIGGVLNGIALGRPELRDEHESGFVWIAWMAVKRLPTLPITRDLQQFWQDVDGAAAFLVGEEYASFVADPGRRARLYSQPHRELAASSGEIRKKIARRYIVGMTPGWQIGGGLGGNVFSQPLPWVDDWRKRFIDGRIAAQRPAGYAQFYFAKENALSERVTSAINGLAHAVERHSR
jgi:hypothetical protein